MNVIIQPSEIAGTVMAPASKSSMQRALAAALVRKGESIIHNPGISNDDLAVLDVIQQMGATCDNRKTALYIQSNGVHAQSKSVNCGESGLGIRMLTPLIALNKETITIEGTGSLLNRPMDFFDTVLPQLGVTVTSNNGRLPLQISGPLQPRDITIDGSLSSQFLTGLLMAYAAADANNVSIHVTNLKSSPYVDLTLNVMEEFGLKVPENRGYQTFYFSDKRALPASKQIHYTVEADWSGAAFLLVAGAIAGRITVKGLDPFSVQADKAVLSALMDCGCMISVQQDQIEIGPGKLSAFHFNAIHCPDLFPPLVALAACCSGTSVIEGVHRLTHKESNRAITLQQEFARMNITIELRDDLMLINGGTGIAANTVHSHHDHRIAMACAVAALKASGPVIINDADAISKSYPDFFDHLVQLGVQLATTV